MTTTQEFMIETLAFATVECERLREANAELLTALVCLAEKVRRANSIQHSGGRVNAEDWSELHQLTNDAFAAIFKADQLAALEVIAEARADIARAKGEQA